MRHQPEGPERGCGFALTPAGVQRSSATSSKAGRRLPGPRFAREPRAAANDAAWPVNDAKMAIAGQARRLIRFVVSRRRKERPAAHLHRGKSRGTGANDCEIN